MRASWSTVRKALKAGNPDLVLVPSVGTLGAMVYLRCPGHEDCKPKTDLIEIMAVASPSFFTQGCPMEDVAVLHGDHPSVREGKLAWVRGYNSLFRRLMKVRILGKTIFDAEAAKSELPSAFRRVRAQEFKNYVNFRNAEAKSDLRKKGDWLKSRQKPIPGNGMPLGWRADMRDHEKAALELAVRPRERDYKPEMGA